MNVSKLIYALSIQYKFAGNRMLFKLRVLLDYLLISIRKRYLIDI